MDHAVPGVTCVVNDDVDLAVAEVCGLLDEGFEVFVVEHVSWRSDCLTTALLDGVYDALCFRCVPCQIRFLCCMPAWTANCLDVKLLTTIDIAHDDLGTFIGE